MEFITGLIADSLGSLFPTSQIHKNAKKNMELLIKYEWFKVLYEDQGCREIMEKSDSVRFFLGSADIGELNQNTRKRAFFHESLINKINEQIHAPL